MDDKERIEKMPLYDYPDLNRRIEYCPDHDSIRWQNTNLCLREAASMSEFKGTCEFYEAVVLDARSVEERDRWVEEHRTPTREFCQRCHKVSAVGFYSPMWKAVAGPHWQDSILCIACFAALGDEKSISWEGGIEFYPVSFRTHRASLRRVVVPVCGTCGGSGLVWKAGRYAQEPCPTCGEDGHAFWPRWEEDEDDECVCGRPMADPIHRGGD